MKRYFYFEIKNWLIPLIVAGALLILGCEEEDDGATCGNYRTETGENCDGHNLGNSSCESLGFIGGTLDCKDNCKYDTQGCISDRPCDPACDAANCMTCYTGTCMNSCRVGQLCKAGICVADNNCNPECSVADCRVCQNGACVTTCASNEVCNYGVCQVVFDCDPACDAYACQICDRSDGLCVSTCSAEEGCLGGSCIISDCDPVCSGDTSFCNEIAECVITECQDENCTQYDPNLHCDETEEGPGCFCNSGWILNEDRTGCVECPDDDTSNELGNPTTVGLPLDHNGVLCATDAFSFNIEAGTSVIINLDGFNPTVNDLDIYLFMDNSPNIPEVASSTSSDDFEKITYVAPETRTYYLIVAPFSGPMPIDYHLTITDSCETDGDCGGFFWFCNNNSMCELTCEDDGVPNFRSFVEETELPIEDRSLNLCLDGADVFLFNLEAMDSLFVNVDFIHEKGNIDTYLLFGETEVVVSESEDDNENFLYTVETTGEYYLIVTGEQNSYTLNVSNFCDADEECGGAPFVCDNGVCEIFCEADEDCIQNFGPFGTCNMENNRCEEGECAEDDQEPNDNFDAAIIIEYPHQDINDGNTIVPELILQSDNEDWYKIRKDVGCNLNIDVNFSHADGNLNVYVYESEELLVFSAESEDDNEHIEYMPPGGFVFAWYWLKIVTDDPNVCIPYEIIAHYFCG